MEVDVLSRTLFLGCQLLFSRLFSYPYSIVPKQQMTHVRYSTVNYIRLFVEIDRLESKRKKPNSNFYLFFGLHCDEFPFVLKIFFQAVQRVLEVMKQNTISVTYKFFFEDNNKSISVCKIVKCPWKFKTIRWWFIKCSSLIHNYHFIVFQSVSLFVS